MSEKEIDYGLLAMESLEENFADELKKGVEFLKRVKITPNQDNY